MERNNGFLIEPNTNIKHLYTVNIVQAAYDGISLHKKHTIWLHIKTVFVCV